MNREQLEKDILSVKEKQEQEEIKAKKRIILAFVIAAAVLFIAGIITLIVILSGFVTKMESYISSYTLLDRSELVSVLRDENGKALSSVTPTESNGNTEYSANGASAKFSDDSVSIYFSTGTSNKLPMGLKDKETLSAVCKAFGVESILEDGMQYGIKSLSGSSGSYNDYAYISVNTQLDSEGGVNSALVTFYSKHEGLRLNKSAVVIQYVELSFETESAGSEPVLVSVSVNEVFNFE